MGALRVALAERARTDPEDRWEFVWIVEPPMFDPADESDDPTRPRREGGCPTTIRSPPRPRRSSTTSSSVPGEATARAYDIVLNGTELASGSVRIHDAELQRRVFRFLGISDERPRRSSGSCCGASRTACPPLWDRARASTGW
jgi:aspartyl-tRNA synthetase